MFRSVFFAVRWGLAFLFLFPVDNHVCDCLFFMSAEVSTFGKEKGEKI